MCSIDNLNRLSDDRWDWYLYRLDLAVDCDVVIPDTLLRIDEKWQACQAKAG